MFNALGIYIRYYGDTLLYPHNYFGATNSGFQYYPYGKKLKSF